MATGGKRDSEGRSRAGGRRASRSRAEGPGRLPTEEEIRRIEAGHPEGLTVADLLPVFEERGVPFSEATLRKWVQLGLLPRSVRAGRPGRTQGSQGFYPSSIVRRITEIRRLMAANLTIPDIRQTLRFRDGLETIERELAGLLDGLEAQLGVEEGPGPSAAERRKLRRQLDELKKEAGELVRRIGTLERRVVRPLEQEAKARAFGTGGGGGAGDLL